MIKQVQQSLNGYNDIGFYESKKFQRRELGITNRIFTKVVNHQHEHCSPLFHTIPQSSSVYGMCTSSLCLLKPFAIPFLTFNGTLMASLRTERKKILGRLATSRYKCVENDCNYSYKPKKRSLKMIEKSMKIHQRQR